MSEPEREPTDESNDRGACCDVTTQREFGSMGRDRWIGQESVLDATLPEGVRNALGQLIGQNSVETFADWIAEIRQFTGGGAISIGDLCHSAQETDHWGEIDGEQYHFLCFYDAVILAALADRPVDIRTASPDGTEISATAVGTSDLSVSPEQAVFSFGIEGGVQPPGDGEPSAEDVYAAVCPYVRAFPGPAAYETWAHGVSATTLAMPLQGATELAAALVE